VLQCSLAKTGEPASFRACSGSPTVEIADNQPPGVYRFTARVVDAAGNVTDVGRDFTIAANAGNPGEHTHCIAIGENLAADDAERPVEIRIRDAECGERAAAESPCVADGKSIGPDRRPRTGTEIELQADHPRAHVDDVLDAVWDALLLLLNHFLPLL
jgi:hypothetical protein